MREIVQIAWARWQVIGAAFGDFQARLFAVLFYFTLFAPFAVGMRLFSDPLQLHKPPTTWLERKAVGHTLEKARQQF